MRDGLSSFSFLYDSFFCGAFSSLGWEKEISFFAQVQGSGYSLSADWRKMRAPLSGSIGAL